MGNLLREEHIGRHVLLHEMLDELLTDYPKHTNGSIEDKIIKMLNWSHQQTLNPAEATPNKVSRGRGIKHGKERSSKG